MGELDDIASAVQGRQIGPPSPTAIKKRAPELKSRDPWPPFDDNLNIAFWIGIGALGLATVSILMPWATILLGGITGFAFLSGKIIGGVSIVAICLLLMARKRFEVPGGKAAVIVDNGTGEIKGIGGMGFWWQEEVDASRFVKLFLDGIKQACGLSKSGMAVFELVYHQIRENPGNDKIELSQYMAQDRGLNERTFRRGLRELLEKEFLYRSTSDGVFFINIRFMFNGDRLAFVRTYHLKGASRQQELPLGDSPALSISPCIPGCSKN
jgi:hypothetical protein